MTSSYSKTSVFFGPHVNEKPAFSKTFSLENVFENITFSVTKNSPVSNKSGYLWTKPTNAVFSTNLQSCCFDNQTFVMHVNSSCFVNKMFVMHVQSCCSANQMFVICTKENLLFCQLNTF